MKTKVLLSILLISVISVGLLAGCTPKKDDTNSSSPSSKEESSAPAKAASGQLTAVQDAVKALYGEDYSPQPVDAAFVEQMYGITADMYKDFFADAPMMNVQVDTFVGIEAAEGKADAVEAALKAYGEKSLKEKQEFPYLPDHLPKAEAAQVVRVDDYVFFVMVANVFDVEDETKYKDEITTQITKAVETIKETIKK